jgi:hypothetical protein
MMRSLDRAGGSRRSTPGAAYDRWDPDQRHTNGSSITRTGDQLRDQRRLLPRVRQPFTSWRGDPSPWLAVGITVLGTIIGFFVVYRWPASWKPHAAPPASVGQPSSTLPSPPPIAAEARLDPSPARPAR